MNQELIDLIVKHSGEIITFAATSLIALIKRKIDLKKIRRKDSMHIER